MDKVKTYAIGVLAGILALITGIVLIKKLVPAEWQSWLITGIVILAAVIGVITLIVKLKGNGKTDKKSSSADPVVIKMVRPKKPRDWFWAHAALWIGVVAVGIYLCAFHFFPGLFYRFFGIEPTEEAKAGVISPVVKVEGQRACIDQVLEPDRIYTKSIKGPVLIKLFDFDQPVRVKILNEEARGEWMLAKPEKAGQIFYYGVDPQTGEIDRKTSTFQLKAQARTRIRVFNYAEN